MVISEWPTGSGNAPSDHNYLARPAGVALTADGEIYVLDTGNHRIAVFSKDGHFLRSFGRAGEGPGEFRFGRFHGMMDVQVVGERVAVHDPTQRRVQLHTRAGEFLRSIAYINTATSLGFSDSGLYLSITPGEENAQILLITEPEGGMVYFGEPPANPAGAGRVADLNASVVGAGDGARLAQVFFWLPLIRVFRGAALENEFWMTEDWWPTEKYAEAAEQSRNAFERSRRGGDFEPLRRPLFLDVAYVDQLQGWVALINGSYVRFISSRGEPGRWFHLEARDGDEINAFVTDIDVSADGTLLCAADHIGSQVRCYAVPGWR